MTRTRELLFRMINEGEISVGEAREELAKGLLPRDAQELVASWVLDRADQGDHWRAGDPERLLCGCVVSYDREQIDTWCGQNLSRCVAPAPLYEQESRKAEDEALAALRPWRPLAPRVARSLGTGPEPF